MIGVLVYKGYRLMFSGVGNSMVIRIKGYMFVWVLMIIQVVNM
jgi:hypothetical protein